MSLSISAEGLAAAKRIAAASGAKLDDVLAAYEKAAKGAAVKADSLFLRAGVITPKS